MLLLGQHGGGLSSLGDHPTQQGLGQGLGQGAQGRRGERRRGVEGGGAGEGARDVDGGRTCEQPLTFNWGGVERTCGLEIMHFMCVCVGGGIK